MMKTHQTHFAPPFFTSNATSRIPIIVMKIQQRQRQNTTTIRLCLLVALLALAGTASAFTSTTTTSSSSSSFSTSSNVSTRRFSEPPSDAPAPVASAGDAVPASSTETTPATTSTTSASTGGAAAAAAAAAVGQAAYGTTAELPESYVRCGKCHTSFALTAEDLGVGGKGR